MPAQKTAPDRVQAEVNTQEALRLRSAALPYSQIAARLQVSKSTAFGYVTRALEDLREERRKRADVLLDLELDRLDIAQRSIWAQVLRGDLHALAVFLRLSERRSRLLGLDAPSKLAPTDPNGNPLQGAVMIYVPDNGRLSSPDQSPTPSVKRKKTVAPTPEAPSAATSDAAAAGNEPTQDEPATEEKRRRRLRRARG